MRMAYNLRCKWSDSIRRSMNKSHDTKLLYALSEHLMSLQDLVDNLERRVDNLTNSLLELSAKTKQTTLYGPK